MPKTTLIYTTGWLPMLLIAIANGTLREMTYGKYMNELRSHQISSLAAIILFYGYTYLLHKVVPITSISQSLTIGTIWLILTVLFEFVFGRYVAGHSWEKLFADYNFMRGRLWSLVLLALFLLPLLNFLIQQKTINS